MSEEKKFNWQRLLIVLAFVVLASGAVGGTTYYVMGVQSKKIQEESDRQIKALEKQVQELAKEDTGSSAKASTETETKEAGSSGLTLSQIKNGNYSISGKTFKMTDGVYKTGIYTYTLEDSLIAKNSNGEQAVIVKMTAEGTGAFRYLVILGNKGGVAQYISEKELGDRVQVESVAFAGDVITLNMVTFGPDDPSCCPTVKTVKKFRLTSDSKLLEI